MVSLCLEIVFTPIRVTRVQIPFSAPSSPQGVFCNRARGFLPCLLYRLRLLFPKSSTILFGSPFIFRKAYFATGRVVTRPVCFNACGSSSQKVLRAIALAAMRRVNFWEPYNFISARSATLLHRLVFWQTFIACGSSSQKVLRAIALAATRRVTFWEPCLNRAASPSSRKPFGKLREKGKSVVLPFSLIK